MRSTERLKTAALAVLLTFGTAGTFGASAESNGNEKVTAKDV